MKVAFGLVLVLAMVKLSKARVVKPSLMKDFLEDEQLENALNPNEHREYLVKIMNLEEFAREFDFERFRFQNILSSQKYIRFDL